MELRRETVKVGGKEARAARSRSIDPVAAPLFEALRAHRLALAKDQGLPPYVIFHDSTLLEMARAKPRSLREMEQLSGVGRAKLDRYGEGFLRVIAAEGERAG